jgi:hypothetical protein
MGLLPIEDAWANKYYLVGTKNDSLIEIESAIGAKPTTENPDTTTPNTGTQGRTPGEQNPSNDTKPADKQQP